MLGRLFVLLVAALGGLTTAQLPEFAQQYRQRLGGAVAELRQVVEAFEADARRNNLSREEALLTFEASKQPFLQDHGASMKLTLARYGRLSEQQARLLSAPALMRPAVVLSAPDGLILKGAWSDFEPALPITPAAFAWAAVGFLIAGGLVSTIRQLFGMRRGRRRLEPLMAGPQPAGDIDPG